jgi:hypothetical protein
VAQNVAATNKQRVESKRKRERSVRKLESVHKNILLKRKGEREIEKKKKKSLKREINGRKQKRSN